MKDGKAKEVDIADFERFALELSELCRKFGIGITGSPTLFRMEVGDYDFNYQLDGDNICY